MSGSVPLSCVRRFVLDRVIDVSGVSGVGLIAEGVEWSDGTASMRWTGEHRSITLWPGGVPVLEAVHGHGGATKVVYLDPADGPRPCLPTQPLRPPRRR
ncbi:hypothetical protein [Nocardioides speluncae]|uniref:hypothetical protein n=1 Tax=Nocardioides speluncae TaxID=2670337 RepID=UPI00197DC6EE|nr:hypothetical protein [Nocardioides speluncae]